MAEVNLDLNKFYRNNVSEQHNRNRVQKLQKTYITTYFGMLKTLAFWTSGFFEEQSMAWPKPVHIHTNNSALLSLHIGLWKFTLFQRHFSALIKLLACRNIGFMWQPEILWSWSTSNNINWLMNNRYIVSWLAPGIKQRTMHNVAHV